MEPIKHLDFKFKGSAGKLITADLSYTTYPESVPIVVFTHGFKGFKNWGAWPLASEIFASKRLPFFKFNFSHNGTTPKHQNEFADLEAFGNNNFKIEYDDLGCVLDFIGKKAETFPFIWNGEIHMIGHSRGGAIALLRAAQDDRISKCVTWASVSNLERYLEMKPFAEWKETGVHTILNGRTQQEMPIYFQFVEAFAENAPELSLSKNLENLEKPLLIIHGEDDNVVPMDDAYELYKEVPHAILVEIEKGDHTFGTKHPLVERKITKQFAEVLTETIEFFLL
ncbi:prolyl oligopeptidase family serine peptidase [Bacteroidia bacterium]|nr:prolyl oligopeptidase family serine peptidase [Bacteroidia bacterium]